MDLMLAFMLKSLLIAGATLGLLRLLGNRSAADRSSVANFGLAAIMLVPAASLLLPPMPFAVPLFSAPLADPAGGSILSGEAGLLAHWWLIAYAVPVAALLLLTLVALARLFALRARASALVEPIWLAALAQARRRMGFRQGAALLASAELASPISFGLMRPVILLNRDSLAKCDEAEAIIAHELAHVARLDWAMLLFARVVTAVCWFNPLVWILAREAHHLREEAADDAVLAAQFTDTEYARLLVSVARHEGRGLLLGAHGVAPARSSLSRRVRRVLDAGSARGPVARRFAAGAGLGAIAFAVPLAALSLTAEPAAPVLAAKAAPGPHPTAFAQAAPPVRPGAARHAAVPASRHFAPSVPATASQSRPASAASDPGSHETAVAERFAQNATRPGGQAMFVRAVHVGPGYVMAVRTAAVGPFDSSNLTSFRTVGIVETYVQGAAAVGHRIDEINKVLGMIAFGATPDSVADLNGASYQKPDAPPPAPRKAAGSEASENPGVESAFHS